MQNSLIEENIIITEPCKNLRALGRNALAGKWKIAIITIVIYLLCLLLPPYVFDGLFGQNLMNYMAPDGYTFGMAPEAYAQMYNSMPNFSALSQIYLLLVTGPLSLGVTLFFLAMFRRHKVEPVDIFLGFEHFTKALGLFLFQFLFIFLWSLLLVVPGIIASIRYSQAFFILADDPNKGVRQCMDESKSMMKGNKAKYFLLGLSFIGWMILSSLPSSILASMGAIVSSDSFIVGLFSLAGSLFLAPVTVYMMSTLTGFYEILAGHLIKETKPVSVVTEAVALTQPSEEAAETVEETVETEEKSDEEAAEEEATEAVKGIAKEEGKENGEL